MGRLPCSKTCRLQWEFVQFVDVLAATLGVPVISDLALLKNVVPSVSNANQNVRQVVDHGR